MSELARKKLANLTANQKVLVMKEMDRLEKRLIHTDSLGSVMGEALSEKFYHEVRLFLRKLQDIVEIWVRNPVKPLDDVVRDWATYHCEHPIPVVQQQRY